MAAARTRHALAYAIVLVLAVAIPPAAFYGWFELRSRATAGAHGLDGGFGNALKHADAAATIYSALRTFGVPAGTSERIVVRLGIFNEYVETYVKRGRKDSTLEMMRDLQSNMIGIVVARRREDSANAAPLSHSAELVVLAKAGILMRSEDDVSLSPPEAHRARQSADLTWAKAWFVANKSAIEKRTVQALQSAR